MSKTIPKYVPYMSGERFDDLSIFKGQSKIITVTSMTNKQPKNNLNMEGVNLEFENLLLS